MPAQSKATSVEEIYLLTFLPEPERNVWWRHTEDLRERREPVLLAIESKKKHHKHEPELEFVRKKKHHERKPSPSPVLAYIAGRR